MQVDGQVPWCQSDWSNITSGRVQNALSDLHSSSSLAARACHCQNAHVLYHLACICAWGTSPSARCYAQFKKCTIVHTVFQVMLTHTHVAWHAGEVKLHAPSKRSKRQVCILTACLPQLRSKHLPKKFGSTMQAHTARTKNAPAIGVFVVGASLGVQAIAS